ncbi:hypothetical protein Peur_035291 [Populus x canadensis]
MHCLIVENKPKSSLFFKLIKKKIKTENIPVSEVLVVSKLKSNFGQLEAKHKAKVVRLVFFCGLKGCWLCKETSQDEEGLERSNQNTVCKTTILDKDPKDPSDMVKVKTIWMAREEGERRFGFQK